MIMNKVKLNLTKFPHQMTWSQMTRSAIKPKLAKNPHHMMWENKIFCFVNCHAKSYWIK